MLGRNLIQAAAGNAAEPEIAWDIANASFDGAGQNFFRLGSDVELTGGTFKPDGTKMFVIEDNNRKVIEYSLSTAWDISTVSFSQDFSVFGQDFFPQKVRFKSDGTKMFVLGDSGNDVNEYDLSTGWDISTASYSQNFSVGTEETTPTGLFFKPDGTKMYVCGTSGDDVNEYDLSTAWDVSTASYSQNFSVSAQEATPKDVFFKTDGTVMFITGTTGDDINRYTLSTAWDVSTASYQSNASVKDQTGNPSGLFIKSDGLEIFVFGRTRTVFKYTVSSAWTLTGFNYSQPTTDRFSINSQETASTSLFFKGDGSKMYVAGSSGDDVNEYSLSTDWDIDTASFSQTFSVSAQETAPRGIFFRNDGTSEDGKQMYVVGSSGDDVNEYSLTTAWDVSTASYTQNFSVSSQSTNPHSVSFKSDGSKMYILDGGNRKIFRYSLSTDWDVSTASYDGTSSDFSVYSQETNPRGFFFRDNGKRMYVVGGSGDDVNQYELSTAWDVSSAVFSKNFAVGYLETDPQAVFFKPDGTMFFIVGDDNDAVVAFNIS